MARITRDDLVVVRSPFFMGNKLVQGGSVWAADDRVVRSYPSAFRPLEVNVSDPERAPRLPAVVRRAAGAVKRPATKPKANPKATASS